MSWLIPSLLSPLFFAVVNHIDKHLLSKFFHSGGAGSLVIFSALIGIPVTLAIGLFDSSVFLLSLSDRIVLVVNGFFYLVSILPYFYAMSKDEASVVAPLYQLTSIFSVLFGILFFNESLPLLSFMGGILVCLGAVGLSLEIDHKRKKIRVKKGVLTLMLLASLLTAINAAVFKAVAGTGQNFWATAFWEYIGLILFGCFAFVFVRRYREEFLRVVGQNSIGILSLNGLNEICAVIAKLLMHFATILAPLGLVIWVVEGFQPFFVFVLGVGISLWFPKLGKEKIDQGAILQKTAAIGMMILGTYLLYSRAA